MKFQKWHFGLVVLVAVFFIVGLIWYFNSSNQENHQAREEGKVAGQAITSDANKISEPLFFYSDTCPHCQKMKPIVQELQKEGYQIKWIDAWAAENQDLSKKYQISGVPTFIRPDGQKLVGEQDRDTLVQFLEKYKK